MRHSVILTPAQVTRLIETGTVVVVDMVKPMRKQKWLTPALINKAHGVKVYPEKGLLQLYHPMAGQTVDGVKIELDSPLGCVHIPYQPGTPLYVREKMYRVGFWQIERNECVTFDEGQDHIHYPNAPVFGKPDAITNKNEVHTTIPASRMPKQYARLFPTPTEVQCVRVRDVTQINAIDWGFVANHSEPAAKAIQRHDGSYIKPALGLSPVQRFQKYIISRFGQAAWDENNYIFLTTLKIKG